MEDLNNKNSKINSNVSFKFEKSTIRNKVDLNLVKTEDSTESANPDYVRSLEGKKIQSSKPVEKKKELVIPLICQNKWSFPTTGEPTKETLGSLEQQAANEIVTETRHRLDERAKSLFNNGALSIPLILQNRVPEGYETDEKLDVSLRPDPSSQEDYDRVPVDQFGLAMLRGMGWSPGAAIGGKNRKCIPLMEVVLRPKGLGLGADKGLLARAKEQANMELSVGAYICICEGNLKGTYGKVESVDDEIGRAHIRIWPQDRVVHLPEIFLQVVSKDVFEKQKDKKEEVPNKRRQDKKSDKRERRPRADRSRSPDDQEPKKGSKKESEKERREQLDRRFLWVQPCIKVRLIHPKYQKGRFFKAKLTVEDVLTPDTIACRTEDNQLLEDVHPKMLETVIPRQEGAHVMVVKGKHRGMIGRVLQRNKNSCYASVQLLTDNSIEQLGYDDISEYVGNISHLQE